MVMAVGSQRAIIPDVFPFPGGRPEQHPRSGPVRSLRAAPPRRLAAPALPRSGPAPPLPQTAHLRPRGFWRGGPGKITPSRALELGPFALSQPPLPGIGARGPAHAPAPKDGIPRTACGTKRHFPCKGRGGAHRGGSSPTNA